MGVNNRNQACDLGLGMTFTRMATDGAAIGRASCWALLKSARRVGKRPMVIASPLELRASAYAAFRSRPSRMGGGDAALIERAARCRHADATPGNLKWG